MVAALATLAAAACSEQRGTVRAVSFAEYADVPSCWFGEGEDIAALLVVAGEGEGVERVPWLVSTRCIAKEDMPSYGSATIYLLGPPYIVDPRGLLRRHVMPQMAPDNVRRHLPLPREGSPVYYIVARLRPLPDRPYYEITAVRRVTPAGISFLELLEMGPRERSELVDAVS